MDFQSDSEDAFPGEACGPDLYETESSFAAFLDSYEERLPEIYSAFDRSTIAFNDVFKQIDGYAKRTKDLRLLVLSAQCRVLNGQFHRFAEVIRTIRQLLETTWNDVHPADAEFGFMERMSSLEALNRRARVLLPLEDAPLFNTRVSGPVSFRATQVAKGLKAPRPDEPGMSEGRIDAAIRSNELTSDHIGELLRDLADLPLELERISAICRERLAAAASKASAPSFGDLCGLLRDMSAEIEPRFKPQQHPETLREDVKGGGAEIIREAKVQPAGSPAGPVENAAHAKALLKAVDEYFSFREPSHPAVFLVREAYGLVGKSFMDSLKILMPNRFDSVKLQLGSSGLEISNSRLQDLNQDISVRSDVSEDFKIPAIESRDVALRNIHSIKVYFSVNEPTSAIPLLLEEVESLDDVSFSKLVTIVTRSDDR